jgi:hypothetical protein
VLGRRGIVLRAGELLGEEVADMDLLHFPLQTLDIVVTTKQWVGRSPSRDSRPKAVEVFRLEADPHGQEVRSCPEQHVERGDTARNHGRSTQRRPGSAKNAGYCERPTP